MTKIFSYDLNRAIHGLGLGFKFLGSTKILQRASQNSEEKHFVETLRVCWYQFGGCFGQNFHGMLSTHGNQLLGGGGTAPSQFRKESCSVCPSLLSRALIKMVGMCLVL
ncbi:hypothetical protein HOLleu_43870 [Holothuria leucospilota]|uniref:Uncharacterized protein n=1 Tax=Holothuria leucospilota TaxID=206669 RepID=A0A9Q1BBA5_HOLLE|nr:hypothetical protein HOLleu_43870 [Holothuria leucospilota]